MCKLANLSLIYLFIILMGGGNLTSGHEVFVRLMVLSGVLFQLLLKYYITISVHTVTGLNQNEKERKFTSSILILLPMT